MKNIATYSDHGQGNANKQDKSDCIIKTPIGLKQLIGRDWKVGTGRKSYGFENFWA